ncbi:hypothetical protein FXF51_00945 [Nonomuraea sp. PA05]|uniref:hypothetical protein n=1 Tax=Nonomuraea sp. PA05 TaxID=2604466 RepID=UPI0011D98C6C|nr:hypothetical protein [Nonomuraea sp. PA05]TYB71039.1 hypothetical protein FXF51_00945 [Nonomuraea sp. PA05]
MSAPQHEPARSPRARRIGCLAWAMVPFVLLGAIVMAPAWYNDHRLALMVERIQDYPLPAGAEFGSFAPQAETSGGDSGDCWYTIRVPISTDRPVHEVLSHYRQARIEDPDGEAGDFSVRAWTLVGEPGDRTDESTATGPVIIDVDGTYSGGILDGRCW